MQTIGPVTAKTMFGGHGIYLDGMMFALIADGNLYLKVDSQIENDFSERGLPEFTYLRNGKEFSLRYFQAPEETLEDSDAMNLWANKSFGATLRAAAARKQ